MNLAIVADRNLIDLFRFAGAESILAETDDEAENRVKQLVHGGDCKIIIVTEKVSARFQEIREQLLKDRASYPIFLVIPDFSGPTGTRITELQDSVNKSMGVKLKTGA